MGSCPTPSGSPNRHQQIRFEAQKGRTRTNRQAEGQASGERIQPDLRHRLSRHLRTSRQTRIDQNTSRNRSNSRIGDSSNGRCDGILGRRTRRGNLMEQPEGFKVGAKEDDLVCRLRKSLYGLKQAPRVWNRKIRDFLKSIGFDQSYSDPCVYINKTTGIIIAMWVDDLIIFGKDMASINDLKVQLNEEYEMKDLGELKYFLGIQVHRDKERKIIQINQSGYNRTILERYRMQSSKPASTPLSSSARLTKATATEVLADQKEYQSMVGSLMYAMLATRPDLAQTIQQISQFSQKPTKTHEKAAKHALRYLNGTIDEGITYNGNLGMKLECWSDANWGGEEGRESVSGFVATIAGGAVTYSSKKQSSVALSRTVSEYMAPLHTLKEQIWLHCFLKEIGYDISNQNTIYCNNQSAIALAHNPEHHAHTKDINIQYHFVRNCVEDGTTRLEYCPTEDMVADGLTKALGPERHRKLSKLMGMGTWKRNEESSTDGRSPN